MAGVGARERSTMPKGTSRPAAGLPGHQLAHAGDAEGGLFDGLGHHVEGLALHLLQGVVDHAGAGDAHVDDALGSPTPWKAPAMKGLSSTALAKTTSLAQPKPPRSAVRSAVS